MTQLGIDACGPERNEELSQFFTPPRIAEKMALTACVGSIHRVLEPAAGLGALIKPLLNQELFAGGFAIDAVDIDARNTEWMRGNLWSLLGSSSLKVECADYLMRPAPAELYDLALVNPPYEDGKDGAFLAKLMNECERICALIRTESLHGVGRYEQVWRHCDGRESPWILRTVSPLVRRANFGGGGGMIETAAIKMSRRRDVDGDRNLSCVDWWL